MDWFICSLIKIKSWPFSNQFFILLDFLWDVLGLDFWSKLCSIPGVWFISNIFFMVAITVISVLHKPYIVKFMETAESSILILPVTIVWLSPNLWNDFEDYIFFGSTTRATRNGKGSIEKFLKIGVSSLLVDFIYFLVSV